MESNTPHLAYEPIAEDYANEQDDPKMRASCREMFLELLAGQRVLEIGCGPGHDGAKFQEVGCEVTAIDLCESPRKQGIGTLLMEAVIQDVKDKGYVAAVLLGHPEYYPRFGFQTASNFNLGNEHGWSNAFMALELLPNSLAEISGTVQYSPAFAICDS